MQRSWCNAVYVAAGVWAVAAGAAAFHPVGRFSTTATNPSTGGVGQPATVTWSIISDGTLIREEQEPSNLIAYLDGLYEETASGPDVTNRTWFALFEQAFSRWDELGGLALLYEPNDDGAEHGEVVVGDGMHFPGVLGVRGDVRIGGAPVDGSGGTVAYNYFPDVSDMVIDTNDTFFDSKANNSRPFRNTLLHEMGHGIGLGHVAARVTHTFIMQPNISIVLEGPQFDDILGLHHLYGDAYEKTNSSAGNNQPQHATPLGSVAHAQTVSIGTGVGATTAIDPAETDFVSIANSTDVDYYAFTIAHPAVVDLVLTPVGPTYEIAPLGQPRESFDASMVSDLALELLDATGQTTFASANAGGLGMAESIAQQRLFTAGDYLVRVSGDGDAAQMYRLDISAVDLVPGDFNLDGAVDAADYTLWRDTLGQTGQGLAADANGDLLVDEQDYLAWKASFGASILQAPDMQTAAVPEPSCVWTLVAGLVAVLCRQRLSEPPRRRADGGSSCIQIGSIPLRFSR